MALELNRTESPISREERYKINENWAKIESGYNGIVDVVSTQAFEKVVDAAKLDWLAPVNTFADLATTYPNAIEGNASMAKDTGIVYRFDGSQWKPIQQIDATAINEVDSRLSAEIDEKASKQEVSTFTYNVTHNLYVNTVSGNDTNDGLTAATAFKTIGKAVTYLRSISDLVADGQWVVNLSGSFDNGIKIYSFPKFRQPIIFQGEVDTNGNPITVFDGTSATVTSGFWIEPLMDLRIEIHNIHFKNFTGYGAFAKGGGEFLVYNCIAENCAIGFAAISNVVFAFEKCKAINCPSIGYRASYNCSGTIGKNDGVGNFASTATGCDTGINITRNSVVHIDYCTVQNSITYGVLIDTNSRANIMGCTIKDNPYGVRCEGGSEWIDNTSAPNTFSGNTVPYGHFGSSRETRQYAQAATNEYRIASRPEQVETESSTITWLHTGLANGRVMKNLLSTSSHRMRFAVKGNLFGPSVNKTIKLQLTSEDASYYLDICTINTTDIGYYHLDVTLQPYSYDPTTGLVACRVYTDFRCQTDKQLALGYVSLNINQVLYNRLGAYTDATGRVRFMGYEVFLMG